MSLCRHSCQVCIQILITFRFPPDSHRFPPPLPDSKIPKKLPHFQRANCSTYHSTTTTLDLLLQLQLPPPSLSHSFQSLVKKFYTLSLPIKKLCNFNCDASSCFFSEPPSRPPNMNKPGLNHVKIDTRSVVRRSLKFVTSKSQNLFYFLFMF